MAGRQIQLLKPVANVSIKEGAIAKPLDTLRGKTIGIHESIADWHSYAWFTKRLEKLLQEKYGVREFVRIKAIGASSGGHTDADIARIERANYDEFAKKVDCAIVGACF